MLDKEYLIYILVARFIKLVFSQNKKHYLCRKVGEIKCVKYVEVIHVIHVARIIYRQKHLTTALSAKKEYTPEKNILKMMIANMRIGIVLIMEEI